MPDPKQVHELGQQYTCVHQADGLYEYHRDSIGGPPPIWSIWDMLRFHASWFVKIMTSLERANIVLDSTRMPEMEHRSGAAMHIISKYVEEMSGALDHLPVSDSLRLQVSRLYNDTIDASIPGRRDRVFTKLEEVRENLIVELSDHTMLWLDKEYQQFYAEPEAVFSLAVVDKFPQAKEDIAAACRCLALNEWTAAVFHLMRVLEIGLRELAGRLKVRFPKAGGQLEYQEWQNIIEKVESEIRKVGPTLPKRTRKKAETLEFYNRAAGQFWHFKDAWRNNVSHAHASYDERKAMEVYGAVKSLMEQLAAAR